MTNLFIIQVLGGLCPGIVRLEAKHRRTKGEQ